MTVPHPPTRIGGAMNEIQQYLAEEIAETCGQGHITRSEALRRLSMLGVSAAVAFSLVNTACGSDANRDSGATQAIAANGAMPPTPGAMPNADMDAPAAIPMANPAGSNMEVAVVPSAPPAANSGAMPPSMTPATGMTPQQMTPPAMDPEDPAAISGPGMGLPTQAITFAGPNGTPLQGAFAAAPNPRGAVLVIHENRGLTDHIRTVVGRFAAAGFTAIGLDLLSESGGTPADQMQAMTQIGMLDVARSVANMRACLDELERRAPNAKLGVVGFCFGGGMVWQLLLSKDPRLTAAAPFYGQLPMNADFTGSNAAVLAFYGELDTRINATRDGANTALTNAGLTHEIVTEPGANHAFFNDTGMNYNAAAATDAWSRVIAWFAEHLS
jgi:carboxymethylenebutenolidase